MGLQLNDYLACTTSKEALDKAQSMKRGDWLIELNGKGVSFAVLSWPKDDDEQERQTMRATHFWDRKQEGKTFKYMATMHDLLPCHHSAIVSFSPL